MMATFLNAKVIFPKSLPIVALVLLTQTAYPAEAYYSIQREGGKQTWSFPETPRPAYHQRLALPGQLLAAQTSTTSHLDTESVHNGLTKLVQTIASFHLLTSGQDLENPNKDEVFKEAAVLDSILDSLSVLEESGASSSTCVNDTGFLITSMLERQGWALKFLDASGKPGPGLSEFRFNFVGDYDFCRSLVANDTEAFKGNYVTWKILLGPINPLNPAATPSAQWGVCMPDSCSEQENTLFLLDIVQSLGLNGTLHVAQAESHTDQREASSATVASIIIICVIGILMFAGTLYDVLFLQWPRWREEWRIEEENHINMFADNNDNRTSTTPSHVQDDDDDDEALLILKKDMQSHASEYTAPTQPGTLAKVLLAFSVYTNGSKVLNTTQQPGSISCLHGIRFLSMSWVILGHTFFLAVSFADNVATQVPILFHRWTFDTVANALVSVDSFFTLSGLLVSYLLVKEMKRKGWRLNWGLFYFHRFWRLTPPYMLVIVLFIGLQRYMGEGPLWESVQPADRPFCEKNWWANLLYINNFVNTRETCLGQTWYLANDMQFFVVSPLMIVPFFFNRILGFASCGIFFLTHVITTMALSLHHKWPATIFSAHPSDTGEFFKDYYITPWCRIGPYIVGIVTGYLLANNKDKIKLTWTTAIIGWTSATAMALSVLYGLRGDIGGQHPSSDVVIALYNGLARSAWAASLCWVIVACVAGWGGFVNTLLSWSPFVVLGRLTYMAYLIHLNIIFIFFGNEQTLYHLTSFNIAMTYLSIMVVSYTAAFALMLGLESPMVGLEKVFLPQRKKN